MAKVRALTKVFVDNSIREEGVVFDYDGPFNRHLEYLDQPVESEPEAAESSDRKWAPKARRADKGQV